MERQRRAGFFRSAEVARLDLNPLTQRMETPPAIPDALSLEIRQCRAQLHGLGQRREALLVENIALRFWENAPTEERIPKWVAMAAIRRRRAEIEELDSGISELVARITRLCDSMPEIVHGTPSLELEPLPALPPDEYPDYSVNRILEGLNPTHLARQEARAAMPFSMS